MIWYFLSLSSVISLATAELLQQKIVTNRNAFPPRVSAILTYWFQALLVLVIILVTPLRSSFIQALQPTVLPSLLIVTLLTSFAMVLYLKSFQVKAISISSLFMSTSIVVSTILGIIFFQESTAYTKFIGIGFVLVAIFFLNYRNIALERNHYYGLLAGILFGVCYVFDKQIVLQIGPLVYMFWVFFLAGIWGFFFSPQQVLSTFRKKERKDYLLIVFSGITYFVFNILCFSAYIFGGEIGKIDAINNTQTFIIILVEYFIFRNTLSVKRKIWSAVIAYIGVLLLAVQ